MLHPRHAPPARPDHKPAECYRSASLPQMRCSSLRDLNPLLSRPPSHLTPLPAAGSLRTSAVTWLSGVVNDTPEGGDSGATAGNGQSSSATTGGGAVDEAPAAAAAATAVRMETERLMSVPTIDIKLELQMRGVEHRDAFEKVDLARRLAEARVSSPSPPPPPPPPPPAPAAAGASATGDEDGDDHGSGGEARETADEKKAPAATAGGGFGVVGSPGAEEGARGSAAAEGGGSAVYARDVAKATRMGKTAIVRELNAMGVAHSRLSDVSILARQYASGRKQAREDAEQARRVPRRARPAPRDGGVSSDAGDTRGGSRGEGERGHSGWWGSKEEEEEEEEEEEPWSSARGRVSPGASGLAWAVDGEEEDEEGEEDKTDGASRAPASGVGGSGGWNVAGGRGTEAPLGGDGRAHRDGQDTSWSIRADTGSVAAASAASGAASSGAAGGGHKGRSRKAFLRARADRMSSRELMKALDDLGARYRIPAPRSELQEAFVSAVLAEDDGSRSGASSGNGVVGGPESGGIVQLSPYETEGKDSEGSRQKTAAGFGTYHSALRWARQLTFDDVLEELKYRGVAFDPRADYSYLTRVLADEVLADEELMAAEGTEGESMRRAYAAELETAMAMTAQELISDLREGGEKVDVTLSKEALAEKLAEMNLRLRGSSPPESASSDAYEREALPRKQRRGAAVADEVRPGRRHAADPPLGLGAGGGGSGGDDVLLELEEAARSVGGAALHVARETAAFVAETAAGFFPETFPANGARGRGGSTPEEQRQRWRRRTRAGQGGGAGDPGGDGDGGGGGGGGGGASDAERELGGRAVRERASGVRRAASGFAQSSVNRAGFAVAQSVANGLLRGAEAAADWAGDGALARDYRGVGAAVALLVVIRFGRSAAQKLVLEGWKMERANKRRGGGGGGGGGGVAAASAAAGGGVGAPKSSRRDSSPSARYAAAAPTTGRRPRRGRAAAGVEAEERRRPRRKTGRVKRGSNRPGRSKKPARKPLWDSESDDDDRGCVVM
ncbi:unnamed protein product [Hapterophycus canaliculatus]